MSPLLILLLVVFIAIWQIAWQPLSATFIAAPTIVRLIIAGLSVVPIAFLMGIPFAVGLHIAGELHPHYVALAWLINGLFTVIGTIAAVVIALSSGYIAVLIAGGASYLLVAAVSLIIHTKTT
jgi:hypothetical protein